MSSGSERRESYGFPVPNARIRGWTAFFLRVGLGMTLLSSGVTRYVGANVPGRFGFGFGAPATIAGEFGRVIPYFEVGFGVALVLGFFTTYAAAGALALELILPAYHVLVVVASQSVGMNPGMMGGLDSLLPGLRASMVMLGAAVLWLSPRATNPYSLDALVFRDDDLDEVEPPAPTVVDPDPYARPPREPASSRFMGRPIDEEEMVTPIDDGPAPNA